MQAKSAISSFSNCAGIIAKRGYFGTEIGRIPPARSRSCNTGASLLIRKTNAKENSFEWTELQIGLADQHLFGDEFDKLLNSNYSCSDKAGPIYLQCVFWQKSWIRAWCVLTLFAPSFQLHIYSTATTHTRGHNWWPLVPSGNFMRKMLPTQDIPLFKPRAMFGSDSDVAITRHLIQ